MKPEPLPWFVRIVGYWRVRNFVKWFSHLCHVQCSGRRRNKLGYEPCQRYVGHDGSCIAWNGEEFTA